MFFKNKNKKIKSRPLGVKRTVWRRQNSDSWFPSWRRLLFYLLEITFLGTVGYLLFFSPFLMINKIQVSGTKNISQDEVRIYFENKLAGKFLWLIPKNNILLISNRRIEKELAQNFPRIATVKLNKIFPETVEISVAEKEFQLIFFRSGQEFLIDTWGKPWPKTDFELTESERELIVFTDESGKSAEDADWTFDKELLNYVLEVREKLRSEVELETGLNFSSPRLISGDLKMETKDGWKIYFNREIALQKSIETLKLVLREKIKPEEVKNLEYIDLRINNKVYYKLKTQTANIPEDKSAPVQDDKPKEKKR